jgi:hypothetical protein
MKRLPANLVWLPAFVGLVLPSSAHAQHYSAPAFDNATVQLGGPRPGSNGKNFFNVEGLNDDPFESYAVADFDSTQLGIPLPVTQILSVGLTLTQANAAFTHDGSVKFYISGDTQTSIQPADDAVFFDMRDPEGLNGQLAPTYFIGSGTFTQVANGQMDTYGFRLNPTSPVHAYLVNQINAGGHIRLVITPNDPNVAATWAGFSNSTSPGPILTVGLMKPAVAVQDPMAVQPDP